MKNYSYKKRKHMNKKLFLSIVILSSTTAIYSSHDCSGHDCSDHAAMTENMDNKMEAAGRMVANKAKSATKSIGKKMDAAGHIVVDKIEDMGEKIAEEAEDLAGEVEVESKNIFEKAKDFIMGLVSSVMNFFHGLFGG